MPDQQFDVVIVGAGFGGIGAAIQLKRLGYDNLLIVDREDDLGGTWHLNRYPGLAVDVPTTSYSYWFEPNPNWSRLFSTGDEIKQYAEHVADKHDVRRHMRFNTRVEGARWDEEAKVWHVALAGGGSMAARFLITATGIMSQPFTPDIPGIASFEGKVIHSTKWDDTYDLENRRVAVIGTGATAVQLVPELAKKVADLTVYQRTPTHVLPRFDVRIPERVKRLFAKVPFTQRVIRWVTDAIYEFFTAVGINHHRLVNRRLAVAAGDLAKIHRFASIRDKELRAKLTPSYDFGCKRPTFCNNWYRTFTKPHVHLHTHGIDHVEPDGIVDSEGNKTVIDTLVLATGFDLWEANFPAIEIIGRNGRNLGKWWRDTRFQSYQGMTMPHFPNLMSMTSPYAFLGLNFFNTVEYQMRHMNRLFTELDRLGATMFEVTEDANARHLDRLTELNGDSWLMLGNCASSRSYYFNPTGEATLLRPMLTRTAVREASLFPLSDYVFS